MKSYTHRDRPSGDRRPGLRPAELRARQQRRRPHQGVPAAHTTAAEAPIAGHGGAVTVSVMTAASTFASLARQRRCFEARQLIRSHADAEAYAAALIANGAHDPDAEQVADTWPGIGIVAELQLIAAAADWSDAADRIAGRARCAELCAHIDDPGVPAWMASYAAAVSFGDRSRFEQIGRHMPIPMLRAQHSWEHLRDMLRHRISGGDPDVARAIDALADEWDGTIGELEACARMLNEPAPRDRATASTGEPGTAGPQHT